jgi:predicted transcriptional regulator
MRGMDYRTIPTRLAALANLSDFSKRSKIPLRTLQRVAADQGNPTLATLEAIDFALRAYRPPASKAKG